MPNSPNFLNKIITILYGLLCLIKSSQGSVTIFTDKFYSYGIVMIVESQSEANISFWN